MKLIVIVGPTGSGKSDLAVRLATRLQVPIISTDSRQVYKGMAIGTAQPTEAQLLAVPHYFIADRPPTERFTCADFEREALVLLEKLFQTHTHIVAVGGSGLYIDALLNGLDPLPEIDPVLRNELNASELPALLKIIEERDPATFATIDRKNRARVIRATEIILATGRPASELRTGARKKRPFDILKIGIDLPRAELYARIDRRVDAMIAGGLVEEAKKLYPLKKMPALQTVGYSELFAYFNGEYPLERAVELIKRNSRRYAKRQMTWFRRDPDIIWNPENLEIII